MTNNGFFPTYELLTAAGETQRRLHEQAAAAACAHFGRKVFLRGVVEVSNYCRENCAYCGMRRENRSLDRFRIALDQLAELLVHHRPGSITDINIQTGEDPVAVREIIVPLVRILRRQTPLGLSVCLGTLDPDQYAELFAAGAAIYIMKFETGDAQAYRQLLAPGTFAERVQHIRLLAQTGWKVSSGFIAGLPRQPEAELLASFRLARELPLDGCSVSPFIPGEATPWAQAPTAPIDLTLNCMAALRKMRPDWVIPAVSALNLAEPSSGYRRGLRAGANLATINLTPSSNRPDYLLYKRDRFIMTEERIHAAISAEGLEVSEQGLVEHYRTRPHHPQKPAPAAEIVAA